jgi:hypothetical protein
MNIATWLYGSLAVASLASLIVRRPWTTRLARRRTPPAVWTTDLFLETNLVVTALWTLLLVGGAVVAALGPLWGRVAYGLALGAFGWLSPRVGDRYSSRRQRAMALSG